jgi:hypothetical protein
MPESKKHNFPLMPTEHWWNLRKKFVQSIPGILTDNYIATTLKMKPQSAKANVLPYLRSMGIIDQEGKPLERAKRWRDDTQYPSVCKEILNEIYPEDLRSAVPGPKTDLVAAKSWFANDTGLGEQATSKMARFYSLLCEADPSKATDTEKAKKTSPKPATPPRTGTRAPVVKLGGEMPRKAFTELPGTLQRPSTPALHIDIQIHISSDASPDQIEKVFESMARHIYNK